MDNYEEYLKSVESYTGVYKDKGFASAHRRTFHDIQPNINVRPAYSKSDYDSFRENSAVPRDKRSAIHLCNEAYKNVGIIRNIIDLMGDFACQGVNLVHRDKGPEAFFQQWFKKVNGKERSERFLNLLYRSGNTVAYRSYADITPQLKTYMKSFANDIKVEVPDPNSKQIPLAYTFFNPLSLDTMPDGDLYLNIASKHLSLMGGSNYYGKFKSSSFPKEVFEQLPEKLRKQITNDEKRVKLERDRLHIAHYKKDDWELWADPLIFAIIDDVMMLERMRLADLSALDGAISNIRLWTMGDYDAKVLPTKEGIDRLRDILASNQGGGTMELVWGPELKFQESATEVHKFLGSEKYDSVLNAIYAGMGVPPTLTGLSGNGGGFTNNFISLKTLVERLQYGRDLLIRFWDNEVELVRRAMGFKHAPTVVFDQMSLSDESAEKKLLIELADRDVISHQTLRERFKEVDKVERVRLKNEVKDRSIEGNPDKAGPFHDANHPQNIDKMKLQDQLETKKMDKQFKHDSETKKMELEQKDRDSKEKTKQAKFTGPPVVNGPAKKPSAPNGRPKNSKDSTTRKRRISKPKSKPGVAQLINWSNNAWEDISDKLSHAMLKSHKKTNMRQITKAQAVELEKMKLDIFTNIEPMSEFTDQDIFHLVSIGAITPGGFIETLNENGITIEDLGVESYRKHVLSLYLEDVLTD